MIITCKKRVPFHWIAFAILPWAAFSFKGGVVGVGFLFSLKKFVENPAGLTFVLSLPSFISIVLQPVVSFLSDRIWTRFGRRKPFVGTSFFGVTTCLVLMPFMPNFWTLLAVYMAYSVFADLNSPMEPLKQEIIPPPERGRATAAMSWCSNLATMIFWFVALGRFDDVSYMGGLTLQGETVIYCTGAMLMVVMGMLITLGIREVDQKSPLRGQRFTPKNFFGGLLDRELWPVYMLVVGSACMNFYSGLGALSNLLYTDQWAYTKQEMGVNVAAGGIINVFAIAMLAIFADKLNRMRAYQTLICLSLLMQIFYYCYIEFILPDKHPSLVEIIVFGETLSILGILTGMVYVPLVYDYVRRNKMGTYNAGAQLVTRLTVLLTLNGVGLFVWGYATLFQPPAGEMTRVVLRKVESTETEVLSVLRAAHSDAKNITANAWQANGTFADTGRGWEIRLRNKDSEQLATEKENLAKERSPLSAQEKMLSDKAAELTQAGKSAEAENIRREAAVKKARVAELTAQIDALGEKLDARSQAFRAQVATVLGDRLITEGDQVTGTTIQPALVLELATVNWPDVHELEKTLGEFRAELPEAIDLRPFKHSETEFGIAASARVKPGQDPAALAKELQSAVERLVSKRQPGLFNAGATPLRMSQQQALTLELMILEDPLDTYVSPITRVVNSGLALIDREPAPDRRLAAVARSLRVPAETNHVRATAGSGTRTIAVTAVMPAPVDATKTLAPDDAVGRKIGAFLGDRATPAGLAQARFFYDRIERAAGTQKLTVAHPVLTTSYAAMKYDYMSGYLWMFVMSFIGIIITIAFSRMEKRGLVRKCGLEEAQAS